ncbi:MAG TPA: insulinase family protein [Planctomycetota bacterium]|nr:insulinase family protein [Planctomycetota bacterium]
MVDRFAGFALHHVHGVPVLWHRDPRFKTFRASLSAQRPLDQRTAARALLPALLAHGTQQNPDRPALARAMERLYGGMVAPAIGRIGESSLFRLVAEAVAGEFLPGRPDQLGAALQLLADYAVRPRLDGDGGFPAEIFAREHAQALANAAAVFDDKTAWARQQALLHGCPGEPYAIPEHGGVAAIAEVGRRDPELARDDCLRHGRLYCVAMGALPDDLPSRLEPLLGVLPLRRTGPLPEVVQPERRAPSRTVEHAELQQSKQVLLFRLPVPADAAATCALHVLASMFGGGPHSRLFQQVREQRSLAYYISAGVDVHKGMLVVQTGLDVAAAPAVEAETLAQLALLQQGEFGSEELRTATATITGPFAAIDDSLPSRMHFVAEQWLLGQDQTPAQRLQSYAAVGKEQVVAAAQSIWHDHSYLLAPEDQP